MAISLDSQSFPTGHGGGGNQSWTHTQVATLKGLLVYIIGVAGSDTITGVNLNGTINLVEVANSPVVKSSGEVGVVHGFFIGSGIPTNPTINVVGTGNHAMHAYGYTGIVDTEVIDTDFISSDAVANPNMSLVLGGRTCAGSQAFMSGQDSVTGITERANWTNDFEGDNLATTAGFYHYNTIGSSDITAGWDQTSDDAIGLAVAIAEVVVGTGSIIPLLLRSGSLMIR